MQNAPLFFVGGLLFQNSGDLHIKKLTMIKRLCVVNVLIQN